MKKLLTLFVCLLGLLSFTACSKGSKNDKDTTTKSEGVMTFAQYQAAKKDDQVVVETYIQAKQGWWENEGVGVASFYTQDGNGGYFIYNMPCSKDDYDNKLTIGAKIKVTGTKDIWRDEDEVVDATWEVIPGYYKASALDVTSKFGSNDLINNQNMLVSIKGAEVTSVAKYNWNGSGSAGSGCDLYFDVKINDKTYSFTVESYLIAEGTKTYNDVLALKVGQKVNLEGFLYWYNGAQPHITSVKVTK